MPQVWTGTADDFLKLVDSGKAEEQPEASAEKPKRKRKEQPEANQEPEPAPDTEPQHKEPVASQEEGTHEPDNDQSINAEQQSQVMYYLDSYKINHDAFLAWASRKDLLVSDLPNPTLADIRLDQLEYILSLLTHDRSRLNFIQHLNIMANRKTA